MSLRNKTINGIKWTSFSTIFNALVQIAQVSIVSRFLSPADFGLMSIVMVVIGFSQSFLDMGISNAIIHKQNISNVQLSTLYWLNVIVGILFFFSSLLISPYVADFYSEFQLINLISLVSITFLIQPFGQQFLALLQKELQFTRIAKVDISSKIAALIISSYLAWKGYGVLSLVGGVLVSNLVQTLLFVYLGWKDYRPSLVFRINEVKDFLSFGLYQVGDRTINYFNFQIDSILIGKLVGVEELGIYSIAKLLIMKPSHIFNLIVIRVTFPAMSKIQGDITKIRYVYLKTVNYLSMVIFPIYAFIFVYASEVLYILFGPRWSEGATVLRILSIWGAFRSTGNPIGSLFLARGEARKGFLWNLSLLLYTPLGIYFGSRWGVQGVSISLLVMTFPLGYLLNWYFLVYPLCEARFLVYSKQIFKPLRMVLLTVIIVSIANHFTNFSDIRARVVLGVGVGGITLFTLYYHFESKFIRVIKELVKR